MAEIRPSGLAVHDDQVRELAWGNGAEVRVALRERKYLTRRDITRSAGAFEAVS